MQRFFKLMGAFALIVCLVLLTASLLPKKNAFHRETFSLAETILRVLEDIYSGPKVPPGQPTPDSPIAVRGGSLNILANLQGKGWECIDPNPCNLTGDKNHFVRADLSASLQSGTPNTLYLDGLAEDQKKGSTTGHVSWSTKKNWLITFTMRNTQAQAFLCSSPSNNGCDTNPTGKLSGSYVYFQTDPKDEIDFRDFDQRVHARMHYLSSCSGTSPEEITGCGKIDKITVKEGDSGLSHAYFCVDGACNVAVGHQ